MSKRQAGAASMLQLVAHDRDLASNRVHENEGCDCDLLSRFSSNTSLLADRTLRRRTVPLQGSFSCPSSGVYQTVGTDTSIEVRVLDLQSG